MPSKKRRSLKKSIGTKVAKTEMKSVTGDLNIVLSKTQLNEIIRGVLGRRGGKGSAMLASDYCCVDAAVGSSVAGPYTGVASSVSIVNPELELAPGILVRGNALKSMTGKKLSTKIDKTSKLKTKVRMPSRVKVR